MPKTSRRITVNPTALREVEVLRTTDLTPGMKRITLVGEQLDAFTSANGLDLPAFSSPGFDDDIRILFAYPGETEPVLPTQTESGLQFPKDPAALAKVYTVRRFDPKTGELDVDFVKHDVGIAGTWAYRTQPGDRVHFFGPGVTRSMPESADWLLVAGDETALPAIARLLEEVTDDTHAQVFIEIAHDSHRQELRQLPGVQVTWLSRHGAAAGTTTLLFDAVKEAEWWEGKPFVWIAGEQSAVRDIRRHMVENRQVPKEDIDFTGYWKRSTVIPSAEDAALPDLKNQETPFKRFHDLVELYPPIAIRTAVTLGIGDLISRGISDVAELASKSGSNERALRKLLRYLDSLDVLTELKPDHYGLTELGEFLANDFWIDLLHADGVGGRQDAGIFGLTEAVRSGGASYAVVTGQSFDELRAEQWWEDKFMDKVANIFNFLSEPVAQLPALQGADHLVIHSFGAGALAREITAAHPTLRITLCALAAQADWLRRDLPESIPDESQRAQISIREQPISVPTPPADVVLFANPRIPLPDEDAINALQQAASSLTLGGRILFIENTFDAEELDEHDCEADLQFLTRDGTGMRTDAELTAVINQAGLRIDRKAPIGRGFTLRELVPTES